MMRARSRNLIATRNDDRAQLGPAMQALPNEKWRRFVVALFSLKPGYGSHVAAARIAGFGTPATKPATMAVVAHEIAHDPRTQAAIAEETQKRIRTSSPAALGALLNLVADQNHKDHARAIAAILDRTNPIETHHNVAVTHTHVSQDASDIAELRAMRSIGAPRDKLIELFGTNGLERIEALEAAEASSTAANAKDISPPRRTKQSAPPIIDGEFEDFSADAEATTIEDWSAL